MSTSPVTENGTTRWYVDGNGVFDDEAWWAFDPACSGICRWGDGDPDDCRCESFPTWREAYAYADAMARAAS